MSTRVLYLLSHVFAHYLPPRVLLLSYLDRLLLALSLPCSSVLPERKVTALSAAKTETDAKTLYTTLLQCTTSRQRKRQQIPNALARVPSPHQGCFHAPASCCNLIHTKTLASESLMSAACAPETYCAHHTCTIRCRVHSERSC